MICEDPSGNHECSLTNNVADVGTKRLTGPELKKLLDMMGFAVATGQSGLALGIAGDIRLEPDVVDEPGEKDDEEASMAVASLLRAAFSRIHGGPAVMEKLAVTMMHGGDQAQPSGAC